jgi:hypothetical protein
VPFVEIQSPLVIEKKYPPGVHRHPFKPESLQSHVHSQRGWSEP